jgi:5,10-methylenetetrahydromethanopterin reductase
VSLQPDLSTTDLHFPRSCEGAHDKETFSVKFSYAMLPDYPLAESLASIKLADELGFYAVYAADEPWHKDLWLLFAAAAADTSQIRLGPSVSAVTLREPSLIAQAAATLDELTGGRAEVVLGSGNFGVLAQYKIDWTKTKPLSRVKEAVAVVRTLLDEGAITRDGEFYSYEGLFTFARPVQERVPVKIGAMRGPKSFQAAGELSDGVHHALSYSRGAYDYLVEHFKAGAERAGKDWQSLDIGAWVVFAVGPDSAAAKEAARSMVGLYASAMPAEQLVRNGVDPADMTPIIQAIGDGNLAKAIELTTPEITEKLSLAGTPAEVRDKIDSEIAPTGVNHMICAITDAGLVKSFTGRDLEGVPDVDGQLRLIHDELIPAFK